MEAVKRTPTVPSRLRAACHRERVLLYSIVTCYGGGRSWDVSGRPIELTKHPPRPTRLLFPTDTVRCDSNERKKEKKKRIPFGKMVLEEK